MKVVNLVGSIRANRFADLRESGDSPESLEASRIEPLLCESRFGAPKIANRRFEAIRVNRPNVMKIEISLQIDSLESPRAIQGCDALRPNLSKALKRPVERKSCSVLFGSPDVGDPFQPLDEQMAAGLEKRPKLPKPSVEKNIEKNIFKRSNMLKFCSRLLPFWPTIAAIMFVWAGMPENARDGRT